MRISYWSSDVCSSDLPVPHPVPRRAPPSGACKRRLCLFRPRDGQRTVAADRRNRGGSGNLRGLSFTLDGADRQRPRERWRELAAQASGKGGEVLGRSADRKGVGWGKSVAVRVDSGGGGIMKKKR